ncbi:MAG: phage minor head protein, partial [Mucinivorans sp.]
QQEYPGGKASNVMERFMRFFASAPTSNLVGAAQDIETSPEDDSATRLAKRIANGAIVPLDPDLFSEQSNNLLRAFTNGYAGKRPLNAADEFSYDWQSPAVITAMENNLYRFSAGKTIAQIQALNELYRKSKNFAEFAKAAQTIDHKFNCQWAQTEYITAGAVAESTATYNRLTTQREIFPYWEYKTVGDAQVRPEHAELDGVVLPMSDAAWSKIYPPNGWRCRCYVVPRMRHEVSGIDLQSMRQKVEDYYKTDDYKNASKQGFGVNRSITGMVFAENQNYVNLIATNKFLDKMRIKDWGARPMAEMIAKSKFTMPVYSGTADEWIKENPYLVSNDNRQHTIPDIVFRRHTTGKYASGKNNRVPLLQGLKDVITCPDEIWLNSEQNKTAPNNRIYIKFYSSQSIVVVSKITNGKLQIHTWFTLAPDAENDFRRGILIKKATQE